jgi:Uma2 family endonuclease
MPCRISGVSSAVPITVQLPDLASQTRFNIKRWAEILADAEIAKLPYRIETDQHGHILMSPPPAPLHGERQIHIGALLRHFLPNGHTISECPVSTAAGVKAVDVAWLDPSRAGDFRQLTLFERAPEICVEILSLSNTTSEIDEKRVLYFDAGATEVWICNLDGSMSFFVGPDRQVPRSSLCPEFPHAIPLTRLADTPAIKRWLEICGDPAFADRTERFEIARSKLRPLQ